MANKPSPVVFLVILLLFGCLLAVTLSVLKDQSDKDEALSRCVPASEKQMDFLRYAVMQVQPGNTLGPGYAVKSADFKNVWMVAARVRGEGIERNVEPAVWAIGGDPDSPHTWLSVNSFAYQFSNLQRASETDAAITLSSDGVREAIVCVKEYDR
jgi:hypothetical protein